MNDWTDCPDTEQHYWFYRPDFSVRPEIVYVCEKPEGVLQTAMGRLTMQDGDLFCLPEEPEIPDVDDEVA
jgi:hypothetical protein